MLEQIGRETESFELVSAAAAVAGVNTWTGLGQEEQNLGRLRDIRRDSGRRDEDAERVFRIIITIVGRSWEGKSLREPGFCRFEIGLYCKYRAPSQSQWDASCVDGSQIGQGPIGNETFRFGWSIEPDV